MKALPIVAIVAGIAALVGAFMSYNSKNAEAEALEKKRAAAAKAAADARTSSAQEAKLRAETGFIASQRAEVEAKSPLWNMFHNFTQKVKEVSESHSAANVKRAADNVRSMRFEGQRENPRSITIYGTPNR